MKLLIRSLEEGLFKLDLSLKLELRLELLLLVILVLILGSLGIKVIVLLYLKPLIIVRGISSNILGFLILLILLSLYLSIKYIDTTL